MCKDSDDSSRDGDTFLLGEDLVRSPIHKAAGTGQVDFDGILQQPLRIHEDLQNGNGGQMWPAGMVLAKYMLRRKRDELRKATSMLGVALGCDLDDGVYITDQQPMLELMQQNITLNSLQAKVKAAVYDWGAARPDAIPQHPTVVLAADCVYFEPAFPLLQVTLQELIGPETVCYFCFKRRRRADMHFLKTMRKAFNVETVTDDPDRDVYSRENIIL
ncbi:hypothetical protein K431DRAFT_329597 [Polychaeton citri CBS 116435]|uniref:Elongation factor methyltransferase 6 n=1 Tax=Polychaeton citri CBS 116435 TaxID=1314669 RepID=A0A9P4Q780_9PEZI|nr:hypothetical protein K431DRAFT_329597 [Polychaeton citri CBS 116435]